MNLHELSQRFSGRSVLVTGHTGFKGGWLTYWLSRMGAQVTGVSLPPDQGHDNIFDRAELADVCDSRFVDIRHHAELAAVMGATSPEVVFHLAAQPLVRRSYREPLSTFETNVMGTANVLEAARHTRSVKAVVCVTTDKVYNNKEWSWPYRETDELGGMDPYSASKAAAEMVARSYMTALSEPDSFRMATARGGNVIGGGDWSEDRIIPDIVRALRKGEALELRHPAATRPWQHVLELCSGYLHLASKLLETGETKMASPAYNFGPDPTHEKPVSDLVRHALDTWGVQNHPVTYGTSAVHEAGYLRLDSSLARAELDWGPVLSFEETITWTIDWYRRYCSGSAEARYLMTSDIERFSQHINFDMKASS